jgi:hypothetical protein
MEMGRMGWLRKLLILAMAAMILAGCSKVRSTHIEENGSNDPLAASLEAFFRYVQAEQYEQAFEHVAWQRAPGQSGADAREARSVWVERLKRVHDGGLSVAGFGEVQVTRTEGLARPEGTIRLTMRENGKEKQVVERFHFEEVQGIWKILKVYPADHSRQNELELALGAHVGKPLASAVTSPIPAPAASPIVPAPAGKPTFERLLTEVSILQTDGKETAWIKHYNEDRLETSSRYALHMKDVNMYVSFDTTDESLLNQFVRQVRADGATMKIGRESGYVGSGTRYRIDLTDIGDQVTVSLGEQTPIEIVRQKPLEVEVRTDLLKYPYLFAEVTEGSVADQVRSLQLSSEEDAVTLTFNEDMNTMISVQGPFAEEWVSPREYRFYPQKPKDGARVRHGVEMERYLILDRLVSLGGNYLSRQMKTEMSVMVKESGQWVHWETKKPVGFSPRDRFYDKLVVHPDRSSYVGAARMGYDPVDGSIGIYQLVLEREGKEPLVIVDGEYIRVMQNGVPVQWMDEKRLLYSVRNQVYLYDVKKEERLEVVQLNAGQEGMIRHAAYDSVAKKLYILTYQYLSDTKGEWGEVVRLTYDDRWNLLAKEPGFTRAPINQSRFPDSPIFVGTHGVYWTKWEGAEVRTLFEGRNGRRYEVPGTVVTLDGETAYIRRFENTNGELKAMVYRWRAGEELVAIKTPGNDVVAFGPYLMSLSDDRRIYDPKTEAWITTGMEWPHFPIQSAHPYYRN